MTDPTLAVTEHRLALVMNGGVSLAVWMGGVAQEIDALRRASNGFAPPPVPDPDDRSAVAEHDLFVKWGELAAAAGKRFTVDVIAGTSAGGLNGVLLAAAIAKGVPLAGLRKLWMEAPALERGKLLPGRPDPTSILDGDYFAQQIEDALGRLSEAAAREPDGPPQAAPADVSLTVTATALGGRPRAMKDRNGTLFLEQDHRRRYRFRRVGREFRYDRADGFDSRPVDDLADDDELGLAARATASFPAAFSPVQETWRLRKLRVWPTWKTTGATTEFLADGGILDNSPFGSVLDAVAAQPVEARWVRTLCYIVPSADELGHELEAVDGVPPPWTSVVGAALGDAREADLRDDVEQMHELVRAGRTSYDVERFRLLLGPSRPGTPPGPPPAAPPPLFELACQLATDGFLLFRDARAAAAVYDALDVAADALPEAYLDPQIHVAPAKVTGDRPWVADAFPRAVPDEWEWTWGILAAQRLVSLLLRSLADDADATSDRLRARLSTISLQVAAVRMAIREGIRDAVDGRTTIPDPVETAAILDDVLASLAVPTVVAGLVRDAVDAFAEVRGYTTLHVLQAALCVEVVNGAGGAPVDLQTRPLFDFLRLGISADPPCLRAAFDPPPGGSPSPRSDILHGSRLNHFAAFGRQRWREWDWMWGRLHAAVQLGSLLGLSDAEVDEIAALILAAENRTLAAVRAEIPRVLAKTPEQLIDDLADDGAISPTIDAVLAMLASRALTRPAAPRMMTRAARRLRGPAHIAGGFAERLLR